MPSRIIRESARYSLTLHQLTADAERLFWRLITVADDAGRFDAHPMLVKAACFPLWTDSEMPVDAVAKWLTDLAAVGLIALYGTNGKTYGAFVTWEHYQRRRHARSKYPAPPASNEPAATCGELPQPAAPDGATPHAAAERGLGYRVWGIGNREWNTDLIKRRRTRQRSIDVAVPESFTAFWQAYPKRVGKLVAVRAWQKLAPDETLQATILRALARHRASPQWQRDGGNYIPHPATWLNGKRWDDELGPEQMTTRASPSTGVKAETERVQREAMAEVRRRRAEQVHA